jgi:predicted amidophosphoribosyltransferase
MNIAFERLHSPGTCTMCDLHREQHDPICPSCDRRHDADEPCEDGA